MTLKEKAKKRRIIRATTPKNKDKEDKDIENNIYESESNYIIIASTRSRSK
jgi:hypothetical protein